jgi:hypothetical protein
MKRAHSTDAAVLLLSLMTGWGVSAVWARTPRPAPAVEAVAEASPQRAEKPRVVAAQKLTLR